MGVILIALSAPVRSQHDPAGQHDHPAGTASSQNTESHQDHPGTATPAQTPEEKRPAENGTSMPGMKMPRSEMHKAEHGEQMHSMRHEMQHGMQHGMEERKDFLGSITHHSSSGTSAEPVSAPHEMLMAMRGNWMLMFHGVAFLNELQQSGARGRDKFFSTNWFMPVAQWHKGPHTLTLRSMLSLEPATITDRRYPELFQLGETAFGKPIVDGQHPHDLFMELAAMYDFRAGEHTLISLYAAPVGDPALGPAAYPHRASASENPQAVLGHHLQDSTHIASDVITAGIAYRIIRLEASGFHGREPDEFRWNIDSGPIDSWSTRVTINPGRNWSMQYSVGRLASPEELHPEEDVLRMTASVMYNRPLTRGNWASSLVWGRNSDLGHHQIFNSYLAETTLRFCDRNYVWGRIENVDRTNELALGEQFEPPGFEEHFLARVQAYTFGYDREFKLLPHLSTALGGQLTIYSKPDFLTPLYGEHPVGGLVFLWIRPVSK